MKVMCINGSEDLLTEGDIYTVVYVTDKGNFLLEEVEVPEPYTSFDSNRFIPLTQETVLEEELEEVEEN